MEPLTSPNAEKFSKALGLVFQGSNRNGKIWVFVEEGASFLVERDTDQALSGRFGSPRLASHLCVSAVYAKCTRTERIHLWDELRECSILWEGSPWLIGGDFNTILHPRDRVGSETNRQAEMVDFAEAIEDCRILDPGYDGSEFTWAKNGLFERLDRILVNERWAQILETTRVTNLPRIASDHGPVLVRCKGTDHNSGGRPFRFQNMWVRHEGFMDLVRGDWMQPTESGGLLNFQIKLARLKRTLKVWNKETFGNIHLNLRDMEVKIATAQSNFEERPTPENRTVINRCIAEYIRLLKMEEDFWRQKATLRWLGEGDKNTKFYQSWVKQKRIRTRIHKINVGGREISDEMEIRSSAVEFFQDLLAPGPIILSEPDLDLIHQLPPLAEVAALPETPSAEEVKNAVFDIYGDSAPGPDGFTALFYQACWAMVGPDVVAAIGQVFGGAYLPRSVTATSIVLIPKKPVPESWSDYRPISLCNVVNKIITKIMSKRMTGLLPMIISPNQSGFVKGRLLNDNVLLAQEMFHELLRCGTAPNVAVKIDMAKAYDRVQWTFLLKVLHRMGFPAPWVSLIERCVGSCWFSVLVNDCMEISHLAYADDIVIFTQAAEGPLRRLRTCLENYARVSGQQINLAKSNFYIAEQHEGCAITIQNEGGFTRGTFPFLYLGVPIYRGVKRTDMFMFLREKIAARISGWAHRHLSFGERKKTHWIGWDQICLPTSEGGLGIRKTKEVLRAFSIKLWWRFREQNSLWARYMKAKYCHKNSPLAASPSGRNSPTWKRLMKVRNQANPNIRWVIGQGDAYFWDDIWLGEYPLRELCLDDRGTPSTKVSEYIGGETWDEIKLRQLHNQAGMPQEIITQILDTPIVAGEPDVPRWKLSRLREFSLATTWETIRSQRPSIQGLDDIWKAGLTKSIAIFNWRLLSNRIPVDSKLQWRKIELASKCQCCSRRPNTESLQHLFIRGWGATCVWKEFNGWFEGSAPPLRVNDTIPDRLQVHMFIYNNMANGHIKPKHWKGVKIGMSLPNHPETRGPRPLVMPVKWHPPERTWIKLNTDGAFSEATNMGGGGGLVRDHNGKLLVAFATPLAAHSALEAELMAIHHGLEVAKGFNLPIWVEADAEQAIKLLNGSAWGPAQVRRVMARLHGFKRRHTVRATFIPREGNKAADLLAKMGAEQDHFQQMSSQNVPATIRAIIRMDEMGVPNLRVRDDERE
ncbi:uncharacterized protein LOC121754533 [Salvia splendens]|uniref:uncharacterized protein LOC121754533 n=2 Tax=Salvia splendens TaxID=180675 RepID=UPI001C27A7D9|nr:uncharacterized protein LOC121754533 [Salvia splendens]